VYEIEKGKKPTMNELIEGGYLKEAKCPNGTEITIKADGKASEVSGG
jgi:competence protein ComGC